MGPRSELEAWLLDHPSAWSGWPTVEAETRGQFLQRVGRLEAAGCPWTLIAPWNGPALTRQAESKLDRAIANVRAYRREQYIKFCNGNGKI